MTVIAGDKEHEHQRDQQHAPPPPQKADPVPELVGEPSVDDVVRLLAAHPQRRDPIMTALHQRMGNAFVQEVIVATAARPANGIELHPEARSTTDAILQSNASALDKGRQMGAVGFKQLGELQSQYVPAYQKARDQLDAPAVKELGQAIIMSVQLARAASKALGDQLALVKPQDQPGADVAIEGAEAAQSASLEMELSALRSMVTMAEFSAVATMTPMTFRGAAISPEAPVVDENTLVSTLQLEIAHTTRAIAFVTETTEQVMCTTGDSAAKAALAGLATFHRPADLELVRAGLTATGVWNHINGEGIPATFVMNRSEEQAKQTGWLNDVGEFDTELMRAEIREGTSPSAVKVYHMIMSAEPSGRARALEEIQRDGALDRWLKYLPWSYAKSLHDALPNGNAAIKSRLQAVFMKDGAWGDNLAEKEYNAPSLTKMFHDDIKTHPENSVNDYAVDMALDIGTLDFLHSYGENEDAYHEGKITETQYNETRKQVSDHTTHEAVMMVVADGVGDLVPEVAESASAGRKALAAGVEGGTLAAGGAMGVDAMDVESGAKANMSSSPEILATYLVGGGATALFAGVSALLSRRTRAKYLPAGKTPADHLKEVNPELATQLGAAKRGSMVEIRVTAAEIDQLEQRGVIDRSVAAQLRAATADGNVARAQVTIAGNLESAGESNVLWVNSVEPRGSVAQLPYITDAAQLPSAAEHTGVPVGRRIETAAEGQEILALLVAGNEEGLRRLGVTGTAGFPLNRREWNLVEGKDGFSIYVGSDTKVAMPDDVRAGVAGHTHPTHTPEGNLHVVTNEGKAPTWTNLEDDKWAYIADQAGLFPSARDVEAVGEGGEQTVHVPFKMKGDQIENLGTDTEGQLSIKISNVRKLRTKQPERVDYYETTLTAYAKGRAEPVWTKQVYYQRVPGTEGLDQRMFNLSPSIRAKLISPP